MNFIKKTTAGTVSRILTVFSIVILMAVFYHFNLGRYLTLESLKSSHSAIRDYYQTNPGISAAAFFGVYVISTALSLPGALFLTLFSGAIFGFVTGIIIISFASTIGATLAFLVSRFLLGGYVQRRFGDRLKSVNEGIEKDGALYLLSLRLVPAFPFFMVNLLMGLTKMRTSTYYAVSQIGMLPATIVFVNAGKNISEITSPAGILSPAMLFSFTLLAVFPFIARNSIKIIKRGQIYAGWKKPRKFDRNLIVIGGGSAGLVSSYIAAAMKASVTLVEKNRMGGDCLNTGCVPSKAIIASSRLAAGIRGSEDFGIRKTVPEIDFNAVMRRVKSVISKVEPHDSVERYTSLGVECLKGNAEIISPWTVEITMENGLKSTLSARSLIIATGADPRVPDIPGIENIEVLDSDNIWEIKELPARLVVLGGGPIGCELGQAFSRLGSSVTIVEMSDRLMPREDQDVSSILLSSFENDGIKILCGYRAVSVEISEELKTLVCISGNGESRIQFDAIFSATGRVPRTDGIGLENIGIKPDSGRFIKVNEYLETDFPNIFACGDVAGPYQFTHMAAHQAWYASVNALLGGIKKFRADYSTVPFAVFTDPEIARAGLNETEALEKGVKFETTVYNLDDLDRAIADGETSGFVKVLTPPGKDRILGVSVVSANASEIIPEFVLAMKNGLGLGKILSTIHIYPTFSEAGKYAAGIWRKNNTPESLLKISGFFHRMRL